MKKYIISGALFFAPAFVFAQVLGNITTLLLSVGKLISLATPIVVGLALLGFFFGLVKYIWGGSPEEGRKYMVWGIVALFVMVSVWGLVRFVGSALGVDSSGTVNQQIPSVPIPHN